MRKTIVRMVLLALTVAACQSPRARYEAQKEEARETLDSLMRATQTELAATDQRLEAAQSDFDRLDTTARRHEDYEQALQQLTALRLRRDSLKIRWETLGAQIRYLKREMEKTK